ncbi:MAG: hypothetical protein M3Y58_22925 [Chloroflexota bacterium]|nr:hypothetical protein [Chloroflexota bacterium]
MATMRSTLTLNQRRIMTEIACCDGYAALHDAGVALLATHDGWEHIFMEWMKGYITDDEYIALRRIGALVGTPDPHAIPAFATQEDVSER